MLQDSPMPDLTNQDPIFLKLLHFRLFQQIY